MEQIDGEGYRQQAIDTIMLSHLESTRYNKDNEITKMLQRLKIQAEEKFKKFCNLVRSEIHDIRVKVNGEKGWVVSISVEGNLNYFVIM